MQKDTCFSVPRAGASSFYLDEVYENIDDWYETYIHFGNMKKIAPEIKRLVCNKYIDKKSVFTPSIMPCFQLKTKVNNQVFFIHPFFMPSHDSAISCALYKLSDIYLCRKVTYINDLITMSAMFNFLISGKAVNTDEFFDVQLAHKVLNENDHMFPSWDFANNVQISFSYTIYKEYSGFVNMVKDIASSDRMISNRDVPEVHFANMDDYKNNLFFFVAYTLFNNKYFMEYNFLSRAIDLSYSDLCSLVCHCAFHIIKNAARNYRNRIDEVDGISKQSHIIYTSRVCLILFKYFKLDEVIEFVSLFDITTIPVYSHYLLRHSYYFNGSGDTPHRYSHNPPHFISRYILYPISCMEDFIAAKLISKKYIGYPLILKNRDKKFPSVIDVNATVKNICRLKKKYGELYKISEEKFNISVAVVLYRYDY